MSEGLAGQFRELRERLSAGIMADACALPLPADSERARCPMCGVGLVVFWGRNSKRYHAHHGLRACPLRYEILGAGETEREALEAAMANWREAA